jgi:hypothetical protein
MKSSRPILAVILFFSLNCFSQQSSQNLSLNDSPIEDQFKYVYQQSSDFEDYKLVKRWQFNRLKTHVIDTLNLFGEEIVNAKEQILARDASIDSLLSLNARVNQSLEKVNREKNSISFLGIMLQKTIYNSILWTIISGLAAALVIFILLFRRSNLVTLRHKHDLGELQLEFEAFRKRALEREETVVRKYHNELMKYKSKVGKLE